MRLQCVVGGTCFKHLLINHQAHLRSIMQEQTSNRTCPSLEVLYQIFWLQLRDDLTTISKTKGWTDCAQNCSYMPPEYFFGKVSSKTDSFAFGIILVCGIFQEHTLTCTHPSHLPTQHSKHSLAHTFLRTHICTQCCIPWYSRTRTQMNECMNE